MNKCVVTESCRRANGQRLCCLLCTVEVELFKVNERVKIKPPFTVITSLLFCSHRHLFMDTLHIHSLISTSRVFSHFWSEVCFENVKVKQLLLLLLPPGCPPVHRPAALHPIKLMAFHLTDVIQRDPTVTSWSFITLVGTVGTMRPQQLVLGPGCV